MTNNNGIMVSVICLTYNHEKYIEKTLDGFVSQVVDFPIEVIVHDDASNDDTSRIVSQYASKYPSIIKPIFQSENQYSKGFHFVEEAVYPRLCGKYIAWCEGDDYWIDVNKIKKQVEILEENDNCSACFSRVEKITFEGEKLPLYFPDIDFDTGVISKEEYYKYTLENGFPWQLSGFMVRRSVFFDYLDRNPSFKRCFDAGDLPIFLFVGISGDIYYIDEIMSYYRTGNPESWIGKSAKKQREKAEYFKRKAEGYLVFDDYSNGTYHDYCVEANSKALFSACLRNHDVSTMKTPQLRKYYDQLTKKGKIFQNLCHYLPCLERPILYFTKRG